MVKRKNKTIKTKVSIKTDIVFDSNNLISWTLYVKWETYPVIKSFIELLDKHEIKYILK